MGIRYHNMSIMSKRSGAILHHGTAAIEIPCKITIEVSGRIIPGTSFLLSGAHIMIFMSEALRIQAFGKRILSFSVSWLFAYFSTSHRPLSFFVLPDKLRGTSLRRSYTKFLCNSARRQDVGNTGRIAHVLSTEKRYIRYRRSGRADNFESGY